MTLSEKFENHFTVSKLHELYSERIIYSGASGIDQLDQASFGKQIDEQIDILSRKVTDGSYTFTKYKLKLISKGRNKAPREISIPTIRDRLAMRSLCNFLTEVYRDTVTFQLPQNIIKSVKHEYVSGYSGCIKLDVADFYPSIRHKELMSRLGRKIRNPEIKQIIQSAISSPTVSVSRKNDSLSQRGVPQGLSVSNILASIYLINIDRRMNLKSNLKYYRYVDDLLILCDLKDAEEIAKLVISDFRKIGLKIHDPKQSPDKSSIGPLKGGFEYLGYKFAGGGLVTPRVGSINRLRESLISTITNYKYAKNKNKGFLLWRLNLRITGCVHDNKSKGWLFFFAEINDDSLLHSLDHFVNKMLKRFDIKITPKKFVRTHKELIHRKHETNYIPNFDSYSLEQKKSVLEDYFGLSVSRYSDQQVEFNFQKRITKQVKDLQIDIMDFS